MSAESIVAELLNVTAVKAVAPNIALEQLPQGTTYPALVYNCIYANTLDYICNHGKNNIARIQVNPLAQDMGTINLIHKAVKDAMVSFSSKQVAGLRMVSCTFYGFGPTSKDEQGIWTKPADYRIIFEQN